MKKFSLIQFTLIIFLLSVSGTLANNLLITNVSMLGQNTALKQVMVKFDISWDNSWRNMSSAPFNWDAAYLFIKYKRTNGLWYHATLSKLDNAHFTGTMGTSATFSTHDSAKGTFFYRSGDGNGTISSAGVKLCWRYGFDGVSDTMNNAITSVQVFGIEMVYVPQGSFQIGSGGTGYNEFTLQTINTSDATAAGGHPTAYSAPTTPYWPNGYNSFYCMKYEITQRQYVAFLNTLTYQQQVSRVDNPPNFGPGTLAFNGGYRNRIEIMASGSPLPPSSATFACDFNNNGIYDEPADGQYIACNNLKWADGTAYADWSGLRPMTELEYEKACRGTLPAVPDEYAWGTTTYASATILSNAGTPNEAPANVEANCNWGNWLYVQGPMRVGSCASGSRVSMGASYYGIMELSGNLWERAVDIYRTPSKAFNGLPGDGSLDANGDANTPNWPPNSTAEGGGFRGGTWYGYDNRARVSDRMSAQDVTNYRTNIYGFRCVLSMP
ncbi:MAG: SUMF1/EgtB/PvdO family nonheme iron enzyme [Candidatus Kapabacteria bacterium]|nr:SUMF1/EgtB/PvdO family nonheme iron enzyme [Candidatus Kapabacteria bacterium]